MPSIDLGQVVGPTGATGPQGPQGIQGNPGPNQITSATATTFNGVLAGSNGVVGVRAVDSTPDSLHTANLITSAAVADAITGVESDLASIHATGTNNTTGAIIPTRTYFYLNGSLVRAKENIGTGAPFTISNYAAVTDGGLNELKAALPRVYSLGAGASATFAANTGCLILVLRNSVAIEALYTVDILGAVIRLVGSTTGHSISYANGQATVSNSSGVVITVSLFNTFT